MKSVEYFISKRGNSCENCGAEFTLYPPPQRHHCLVRRSKNNPALDEEINIELVCASCHMQGYVDTFEHRQEFAMRQVNRGLDVVGWYQSLGLRAPEAWLMEL